ncbi:MAG: alpha/beta hydrolase [Planctomycetaceae bacterium]|nr:alpha/beta hydrolase [Planctomycetaceae bacterium]
MRLPHSVSLIMFAILCSCLANSRANAEHREFEIWPGELPEGSVTYSPEQKLELSAKTTDERIAFVERPTLTAYPADPENATGCAVVICPGGGYNILAWPKEGLEVAEWFNSIGVTAFVLKYRVPRRIPDKIHWEPMQDVQRAIRLIRHQAEQWRIDPNRIGTLGFSAGGHLTVMSGVQYETKCYVPVDEADEQSCRPDFMCPIYCAYLGDDYDDKANSELGDLVTVTDETPPTFLAVTWDDALRGAQSALLFVRLKEHNVPAELHVFTKGGHGYGLRPSENAVSQWPSLLHSWMSAQGLLDRS